MSVFSTLQSILINGIVAVLIIFLGLIFGRFLGNLTKRVLKELEVNRLLKKHIFLELKAENVLGEVVKYASYITAVVIALNKIGVTGIVLYIILSLGVVITVGIVLFDVRDFSHNLIVGLFSKKRKNLKKDQEINISNVKGNIISVGITEIRVKTKNDDIIIIPSSLIIKEFK
ncbi:mechanosensitive ion channel [Candidatus Woesearchaeota archaeon]|nr:mechanosensitive ion channel [Candidatus Woesearchaeota archaeon]